ncbi:hypothetical protein EXIGLDRAFT_729919 [Exidia glandulosa HHB12029]|uniref:F-box domain-containing protein n=1 Tax=Exidia glandulosa HHB12029 TaxID=1314781 RepID=A0A165CDM4_EXIGL|nr:hypothetical protein EXIGLDRAFT_729919 [Exidia glandulosa HHB12029]
MPDELLSMIMGELSFQDLIFASHICGRWRRRMLACPELWNHLHLTKAETNAALPSLVARSRHLPLFLHLEVGAKTSLDCLHRDTYRICALGISTALRIPPCVVTLLARCFPTIEAFELRMTRSTGEPIPLPVTLFQRQDTRLRRVTLENVQLVTAPYLPLSSITVLTYTSSLSIPIGALQTVCNVCVALQELRLNATSIQYQPNSRIFSQSLQSLSIACDEMKGALSLFLDADNLSALRQICFEPRSIPGKRLQFSPPVANLRFQILTISQDSLLEIGFQDERTMSIRRLNYAGILDVMDWVSPSISRLTLPNSMLRVLRHPNAFPSLAHFTVTVADELESGLQLPDDFSPLHCPALRQLLVLAPGTLAVPRAAALAFAEKAVYPLPSEIDLQTGDYIPEPDVSASVI